MKKINLLGILASLLLVVSCSVKKNNDKSSFNTQESLSVEQQKKLDSDGDSLNDYEESILGFDPLIGNYPELEVRFLQNFNIEVLYEDNTTFNLDTAIGRNNPDFEYKMGQLFLRENVLDKAASYARFSEHSWGEIKQRDFSWVKYPELDKFYYHAKSYEFNQLADKPIKEVSLSLDNTLKLVENGFFREIKDLEVNFYYYDYKNENYTLLHTEIINKKFQEGVREDFSISIKNVPVALLKDNYFKKGEFIISEVKDFFIPKLNMKFSRLKASMEAKTTKLFYITPIKSKIYYVATEESGNSFIELLSKVFTDKFTVETERLIAANQFKNNLGSFRHLEDVKAEDKNGNWFVMTEDNKDHYINHNFKPGQTITMAYMTGTELARRSEKKLHLLQKNIESGVEQKQLKLGDITSNSNIKISVKLKRRFGDRPSIQNGHYRFAPRCSSRNCSGCWPIVDASYEYVTLGKENIELETNFYTKEYGQMSLMLHGKEVSLTELVDNNVVTVRVENGFFNIYIRDIAQIAPISKTEKNTLFLLLKANRSIVRSLGINLTKLNQFRCMPRTTALYMAAIDSAVKHKTGIGVDSIEFNSWQSNARWGQLDTVSGYPVKKENQRVFPKMFSVDVVSSITNYYN